MLHLHILPCAFCMTKMVINLSTEKKTTCSQICPQLSPQNGPGSLLKGGEIRVVFNVCAYPYISVRVQVIVGLQLRY